MAKADKSTAVRRTQEVLRLLLAGGEFEDIRQYAAAQGWQLSNRQLRRYQERAYQKLAEAVHRDQRQLLGRHLMQRRALYARALKTSDVRTALNVLRDEAELEGLYPSQRSQEGGQDRLLGAPPLSREERFLRLLAAETKGDEQERKLMEHLTPQMWYRLPDTMMPRQMLNTMALMYASEQLDHASMFFMGLWRLSVENDGDHDTWDLVAGCHAFRFKMEMEGWEKFTSDIGVNGHQLLVDNHHGTLLELFADRVYEAAPSPEVIIARFAMDGTPLKNPPTAESVAREWRDLLGQVLRD